MFTKFYASSLFICFLSIVPTLAHADKLKVVTTLPELAWLAQEIMGDEAQTQSLLSGVEDPHYIDASPAFVFKVAKADLVIFNGLELEVGWLPKVLQMSGHSQIQPGEKGHCDASSKIEKLEQIQNYDRSKGDIHPMGNPHYTLSAKRMAQAAESIFACLSNLRPELAKKNASKFLKLQEKLNRLHLKSSQKLAGLKDKKFMVYHREFSYFLHDHGLRSIGSLEEVPGVLPSALYLSKTATKAREEKVSAVLASSVAPKKYLARFRELSKINPIALNLHPQPNTDYVSFYEQMVDEVFKNAQ